VLREYRVLDALQATPVPVPTTVAACEDPDVLGCEFYLMELVDGEIIGYEEPERFATPEHRRQAGEELVETLADLHLVDYEAVGLEDFGRPGTPSGRSTAGPTSRSGSTPTTRSTAGSRTSTLSGSGSRRTSPETSTSRSSTATSGSTTRLVRRETGKSAAVV
jgi:hypothetical protein